MVIKAMFYSRLAWKALRLIKFSDDHQKNISAPSPFEQGKKVNRSLTFLLPGIHSGILPGPIVDAGDNL